MCKFQFRVFKHPKPIVLPIIMIMTPIEMLNIQKENPKEWLRVGSKKLRSKINSQSKAQTAG